MQEDTIQRKVLEYLDSLCLFIENIDCVNKHEYIAIIERKVKEYKEYLRNEYSLKRKRNYE